MVERISFTEKRTSVAADSLWGASMIAKHMGTSDDYVRKLATDPDAPVWVRGGRYYSTKTAIASWLLPKPDEFSGCA